MNENRILYSKCLQIFDIENSFIDDLEEAGLVRFYTAEQDKYIECNDLKELEQFIDWHRNLDINIHGIEALFHLVNRMKLIQNEMVVLKNELAFYKSVHP